MAGSVNARRLTRKIPLTRSSMIRSSPNNCSMTILPSLHPAALECCLFCFADKSPRLTQRLQHSHAAAGAEVLAGDERGLGRAEEGHRRSDLGRMRQPPDAPPAPHPAHFLEKLGVGPPGLAE